MTSKSGNRGVVNFIWTPELKQKVAKVCDIFPVGVPKENIAVILEYYDFDVDKAISAFTSDGGATALNSWKSTENNQTKMSNKNKKRKKKNKKDNTLTNAAATSTDAEDSSSIHSNNIDVDGEKLFPSQNENEEGSQKSLVTKIVNSDIEHNEDILNEYHDTPVTETIEKYNNEQINNHESDNQSNFDPDTDHVASVTSRERYCSTNSELSNQDWCEESSEKPKSLESKGGKIKSSRDVNYFPKHKQRSSSSHSKANSDDTHTAQLSSIARKGGFDKCKKDLNRQTVSLQRIKLQLETGLEDASKRIRNTFTEVRKLLEKKQAEMEEEMQKVKNEAMGLLQSRQDLAADLKMRCDRIPTLSEVELNELRADIKQFVTERKYDEELGKTIWFHWSMDNITEAINKLGEVHPVKNAYSQRSHNIDGNIKSDTQVSAAEPCNTFESKEDESENQSVTSVIQDNRTDTTTEKDFTQMKNQGYVENRPRVFSNRRYNHNQPNFGGRYPFNHNNNRGRGGGGGYFKAWNNAPGSRGRYYDNNYRQYNYRNDRPYFDYKQQHFPDRMETQKSADTKDNLRSANSGNFPIKNSSESKEHTNIMDKNEIRHSSYQRHQSFNNYRGNHNQAENSVLKSENFATKSESVTDNNLNCEVKSSPINNNAVTNTVKP